MRDLVLVVDRAVPVAERIVAACMQVMLASSLLIGAVIAGHELRAWREWYPNVHHPWLDGPLPAVPRER
jgi:hypothetical protein